MFGHLDNFSFSYYNDGGQPISFLRLGDREDRYWTGGMSLALKFHNSLFGGPQEFIVSFDKYTGFTPYNFELSTILYIDQVFYRDVRTRSAIIRANGVFT